MEMVSQNGWYVNRFMEERTKAAAQRLLDISNRVEDPSLQRSLEAITISWNEAFGHAPPVRVMVSRLGDPPDPEELKDQARFQRQEEVAEQGGRACDAALNRLNDLERI